MKLKFIFFTEIGSISVELKKKHQQRKRQSHLHHKLSVPFIVRIQISLKKNKIILLS